MTLNDLFKWCDSLVSEASETVLPSISTTQLCKRDILNEAASEFVRMTLCFPKEKKFNVTANNYTYSISSQIPDFLEMREEGVWHLRSSTSINTWDRLKPTTIRELDQKFTNWRNQSANDAIIYYWQEGDFIGLFYTPSSSVTNGLWTYYFGMSSDMSSLTNYPFTGTGTRDPRLSAYEKDLLVYYESKALGVLGYRSDAEVKLKQFYDLVLKAKSEMDSRRDLAQDSQAKARTNLNYGNQFRRR